MNNVELPIASPCSADWTTMTLAERGRFCGECRKVVHELGRMTEAEARALLASPPTEGLCVRYIHDERGEIVFRRDVVPASSLARARRVAATALALALPLTAAACTSTAALTGAPPPPQMVMMGAPPALPPPPPSSSTPPAPPGSASGSTSTAPNAPPNVPPCPAGTPSAI